MKLYRVQKVTPEGELEQEVEVRAATPEEAASTLVTGKLYRGQRGDYAVLRAKVYAPGPLGVQTLIRLYERVEP
jgi:hypothetical protein